jgi:2'-5' RNA ligase
VKFRSFIAVDLQGGLRAGKVLSALRTSGADLKLVEEKNLHLTLRFLGDTEEARVPDIRTAMEDSVEGASPFELRFRGLGVFPNQNYIKVVWIGLDGAEPLVRIAQKLDDALGRAGFGREGRFSPHLTVARVRSPRNRDRLLGLLDEHAGEDLGSMTVGKIALKKSVLSPAGPTYTTVEETALGAPGRTGEPVNR